jgi:hypothetical protein
MAKPAVSGVSFSPMREPFRPAMDPEQVLHSMLPGVWQPLEALPIRVCVHCGTCVARFQQQMGISRLRYFARAMAWRRDRVAPDQAIAAYSLPLD